MAQLLILGGGALGCAVAAYLAERPDWRGRIQVLERDPSYAQASSARSAASIRQQFSTPLNIALSQFGLQVLRAAGPAAALVERGYLYLAGPGQAPALAELQAEQRCLGAPTRLMDRAALRARWPWLQLDDIEIGAWGEQGEGWFDGWGLMMGLRARACAAGVEFLQGEALALQRHADGSLAAVDTTLGRLSVERVSLPAALGRPPWRQRPVCTSPSARAAAASTPSAAPRPRRWRRC